MCKFGVAIRYWDHGVFTWRGHPCNTVHIEEHIIKTSTKYKLSNHSHKPELFMWLEIDAFLDNAAKTSPKAVRDKLIF